MWTGFLGGPRIQVLFSMRSNLAAHHGSTRGPQKILEQVFQDSRVIVQRLDLGDPRLVLDLVHDGDGPLPGTLCLAHDALERHSRQGTVLDLLDEAVGHMTHV